MANIKRSLGRQSSSKQWFRRSGWFFLLIGSGALLYFQAIKQKHSSYEEMAVQLKQLEKEKAQALEDREELLLQIQSQSDPAWVEMVLKRDLGMAAEGQMKIYFQHDE